MARWSQSRYQEVISCGRMDGEYHSHCARQVESRFIESGVTLNRLRDCCIGITSGHTPLRHDLSRGDVFFITVECVSPIQIDYGLAKRVFDRHYDGELSRVALTTECVVVTIKRRIAQASPCYGLRGKTVVNQDVAVLKLHSGWNPGFISTYLISKFGQQLADREKTEQMNPYLPVNKLGNLLIPRIGIDDQQCVDNLIKQRFECLAASENAYIAAKQVLEAELGLDKLHFKKPMGYTARLSDVVDNCRIDADYYQVKYKQIDNVVARFPVKKIRTISEKLETGNYSQSYSSNGRMYLRGADIDGGFICSNSILRTNQLVANSKTTVIKGDILVTRVGSIGVCAIIEDKYDGSFYSDNLIRIRLSSQAKKEISAPYLNLLLNTTYGQMQMVRYSRGSVQQRLNQAQLGQIPIPIINQERQLEIENLLDKHLEKKEESETLLVQAKTLVEQLIEKAVRK